MQTITTMFYISSLLFMLYVIAAAILEMLVPEELLSVFVVAMGLVLVGGIIEIIWGKEK